MLIVRARPASLSPDGRFLFFHREGDLYWVSTSILVPHGFNVSDGHGLDGE